jgi:hypothetical protein
MYGLYEKYRNLSVTVNGEDGPLDYTIWDLCDRGFLPDLPGVPIMPCGQESAAVAAARIAMKAGQKCKRVAVAATPDMRAMKATKGCRDTGSQGGQDCHGDYSDAARHGGQLWQYQPP